MIHFAAAIRAKATAKAAPASFAFAPPISFPVRRAECFPVPSPSDLCAICAEIELLN
jgi:hypothetical protein